MTTRAKDPTVAMRCPSPLVLFGIDSRGKPQGARFRKKHASVALKAATQLQLKVLASSDPKVAEIAARLPVMVILHALDSGGAQGGHRAGV
jgi:hypothetical protein